VGDAGIDIVNLNDDEGEDGGIEDQPAAPAASSSIRHCNDN